MPTMWNQLRQEQEHDDAAAASDKEAAAWRRILPTSQPSPMATPAKPRTPQRKTPGSTSRYADYLSEVADTSDIVTPGKSPLILTAPTFEDDAADADDGAGAGAGAGGNDDLFDGLNFDDVGASPGGAAAHRHSSSSSSSDNAVTMDVASKSEVPFATEFTAGFFPPHIRSVPSGIGGMTNASSVSGITDMASGMSSSSGDGVVNSNGSTPDDSSPDEEEEEEEEVEEIIMSSDSNEEEDSDEIGNDAGDGTTPVPVQQQTVSIAPTSAPQTSRGPLSPFSPDARRARTEIRRHRQPRHLSTSAPGQWSLLPCRKVSVLVRVKPPGARWDGERRTDDEGDDSSVQLGIFPLLSPGVSASHAGRADDNAPAIGLLSLASELSSSAMAGSSQAANSLVVVNPTAFGTRLPSDLTMETARLVAEVGNIDSEDWARRYRFDDILWPNDQDRSGRSGIGSSAGVGAGRSDGTLIAAARAMAGDALSGRSSVLCTLGSVGSGRSYSAFGRAGLRVAMGRKRTRRVSSDFDESDCVATLDRAGILGLLVAELNGFSRTDQVDFTVSLLEVVDDDVLRDLFRTPNAEFDSGQPRLRHPDHFGAVVQNLTELTFGSVKDLEKALSDAAQHSVSASNLGRGHLIATVKIAVSNGRRRDTTVQIVDLNPGEDPDAEVIGSAALDTTQRRRAASVRKSLSGLRGVLRGLIVQEAQKSSYQTLSYRECTLTKLLQRSLDSIDSRAILIACVDPDKEAYHRSVQTLNYVNRLWIKPGITAQSPFEAKVKGIESVQRSTARTLFPTTDAGAAAVIGGNNEDESEEDALLKKLRTSTDRSILTSLVSDPRQRVATLLASSEKADKRHAEPEPASPAPTRAVVKKPKSSSSSTIRKKVGGTFDSVLAKLDALESSPTYDRLRDDFNDTVDSKNTRNVDLLLVASKPPLGMPESSSVAPSVSSSQSSSEDVEEFRELKQREAELRTRLGESKNALAVTKLELEAAKKKDAQDESEKIRLEDKVEENIRLGEREAALVNELNALRSYANHAAGGNIREQQRLNDLIDQLRQEIADEKVLTMKYREEASKSSGCTSIAPSQATSTSTSSSEAYLVAQIEALRKEKAQLQMDVADERLQKEKLKEEVKQASSSSGSQTASTGDADLIAQIEELQQEKEQRSTRRDEEIKASDDALAKVKEELVLAKDQAKIAHDAKRLAEDELGLMQATAATTEGEGKIVEAASIGLKDRQIDQLKAEKKLMQQMALSMKRRLETDKTGLQRRLETVQEEADAAKYRQGLAENELEMMRVEASSSTKSSEGDLQRENEVLREELKRMKDSSSESHTSSSEADLKAEIERLQSQVIRDSANNADAIKLLKEELGEARYDKLVAEEEARLLRADDTSKSSGGNSASEARLAAELTTTRNAFEEHKTSSDREKKQLEYDKSALQARLSAVINQDIRTSSDVIDSLRQKLRESYDKAKAREDDREHQREQLLGRISELNSALEQSQYAELVAKEEARVLKESSSSQTTSSSEAELASQLRAAQESLEEHKRGSRQLNHDKDALKARLATLVDEIAVLQEEKSDAIAAQVEEKVAADQKGIRIQQLLTEISDMSEVKKMTDDELDRVRGLLVAATSSSGEGESLASKSARSIASSNESALIAKIEKLQAEKRKQTAKNAEAARIAKEAMAAVRSELEAAQKDAMIKAAARSDEIKDSDDALALVKGQLEEAYAKAREKAYQRLAEKKASDDKIADLMVQVREAVHAQKLAEKELKKERGSSSTESQESSNDTALLAQIESLIAAQKEQEAQSTEAARIAEDAISAVRAELETAYNEARAKAMKRSDEIKDSDDALALVQEQLDEAYSKAISKASEREAEIKASDDLLADTKAQLEIAKEQARLAYDAKVLAEDELRAKSSSSGNAAAEDELRGKSSSSSSSSEGLLLRQIDQLKAEKKLTQQMAVAMKKRLEGRNLELTRKLDTLQEEVDDTMQKLSDERSRSSAETSSFVSGTGSSTEREERLQRDLDRLRAEKKNSDENAVTQQQKLRDQVTDLEAQVKAAKTAKLLAEGELRRRRDGDSADLFASDEAESKAVRVLQRQLAESRAKEARASEEKRAVDRRLDKETEAKLDAEQKLEDLQKRWREKQLADRLSDTSSASGSNTSVTDALKARVRELEAERMVTMENFRALEQNLTGDKTSIGDEMNYLRNKQVQSLIEEIEQLEKAVDSLTDENEELQKASIAIEKDQNLQQRLLEGKLAPAINSDGSGSPLLEEQVEALTSHIDVLKHQLAVALRGEEQSKAAERSEREEVLSLQSRMDKTLMQLQALKSSSRIRAAAKEEEISSLREKLKHVEANNESLRSEIASSDLSTMKSSQSNISTDEMQKLRRSNQELRAKIEELTTDLSTTKKTLIENQENTMNIMSQYESIRLAKEEDEHLLRQFQAKTRELEQTVEVMRTRNDIALSKSKKDAMSAEDKLHKRINVTEHAHAERVSLLERRLTEVHNEREDLREKNEDLVKQLAHERHVRREQSIEAKKATAILQEEIDTAKEEMVSLHNQMLALTEAKNKVEEKLGRKKDQILALESEAKSALENYRMQKRLESENSALRSSIKQCDESMEAMRKEVFELKSAADEALARLEAKKESSEKRLRQEIRILEEKLQASSSFEREETEEALRNAVGELEKQLRQTSDELQGANLNYHDAEEKLQTLIRENDSLKQDLHIVETELRRHQGQPSSSFHSLGDEGRNMSLSESLRHERSLRVKAEEIALNLAERAKAGALDSHSVDSELGNLNKTNDVVNPRTRVIVASGKQEGGDYPLYFSRHHQAIEEIDKLKPVVSSFQSLYEMKDQSVRELQSNLSSTLDELERYKRLSSRLQQQIDEAESLPHRRAREEFSASAAAASAPPRPDRGTPYRSRYSGTYDGRSSTADEATQRWRREY